MRKQIFLITLLLLAMFLIFAPVKEANAIIVSWVFDGFATGTTGGLSGIDVTGKTLHGSYSWDSSDPPEVSDTNSAGYYSEPFPLNMTFDGLTFTSGGIIVVPFGSGYMNITNDYFGRDSFYSLSYLDYFPPSINPQWNGLYAGYFAIELWDNDGTVFNDTTLPNTQLHLNEFESLDWIIGFYDNSSNYYGSVNGSISVSSVPIPSAVWLLGSGLIGIVGVGRKFKN